MGLDRKLSLLEAVGEGCVVIPFGFTINGTSDPTAVTGDHIVSITRSEAGEFLGTLVSGQYPYSVFCGFVEVANTADDVDIYGTVDWTLTASAGTFRITFMTGGTQTDPTTLMLAGGFLLCKKTDRVAVRP